MKDEFDINLAKKTLACEDIVHFNNAEAELMPIPVSSVLHGFLDKEERMGGYIFLRGFGLFQA
jgi:hypothetical protein